MLPDDSGSQPYKSCRPRLQASQRRHLSSSLDLYPRPGGPKHGTEWMSPTTGQLGSARYTAADDHVRGGVRAESGWLTPGSHTSTLCASRFGAEASRVKGFQQIQGAGRGRKRIKAGCRHGPRGRQEQGWHRRHVGGQKG